MNFLTQLTGLPKNQKYEVNDLDNAQERHDTIVRQLHDVAASVPN